MGLATTRQDKARIEFLGCRKSVMEFWIGLSVGMHLGKVIADYLQKFVEAYGLLDATTLKEVKEIEDVESEISSIADELVGD
jgi:hypothetical protein